MGLFSSSKVVQVSSTAYNLAGEEKDRPDFLKSLVVRNVLSGTKKGMGESMSEGYLAGPGIKYRSFFRWARLHYRTVGMPKGRLTASGSVNSEILKGYIPRPDGWDVWIQSAEINDPDYYYWADQYISLNFPSRIGQDYVADIDDKTLVISITFSDGAKASFAPSNFVPQGKYIFAKYNEVRRDVVGNVEYGPTIITGSGFPNTSGWTLTYENGYVNRYVDLARTETIVTEFPGSSRPTESSSQTTYSTGGYVENYWTYSKETGAGQGTGDSVNVTREVLNVHKYSAVGSTGSTRVEEGKTADGVAYRRTIMVTQQYLYEDNRYRVDRQNIIVGQWSPVRVFIYRIGSGVPVLDAMQNDAANYEQFYPYLPLRLDNKQIDKNNRPEIYNEAKKAFRKAGGGRWDELSEKLLDNEKIGDIDYAYVVFGVSLNVIEPACKKYLWEFFLRLMQDQKGGQLGFDAFIRENEAYNAAYQTWKTWKQKSDAGDFMDYAYPPKEPRVPGRPSPPQNTIVIQGENNSANYDVRMFWNYIAKESFFGQGRPGAKKDDMWFVRGRQIDLGTIYYRVQAGSSSYYTEKSAGKINEVKMFRQISANNYEVISIVGAIHQNFVYGGKSVDTDAWDAIQDGEESPFIVPLHYGTYREMTLVDATQMSTACTFLVVNSYVVKKIKWYQKGFFKVLFVIVIAIISVTLTGGAGFGLLGTHLAVGSALGLSGLTAAIVGSIANALAALVVTSIIDKVTAGMGIFGTIVNTLVKMVMAGNFVGVGADGFTNLATDWSQLLRIDNLMKLTDAVGGAVSQVVQGNVMEMQQEMQEYAQEAEQKISDINKQYMETFGYGGGSIDPLMFAGTAGPQNESRDTFLLRTLMTGSDMAGLSLSMISDFASMSTTLPDAFS